MAEPAIAVHALHKSFGAKEAVAGIDLEIAAGSFAGLVGPNGAGKTTSLSMMTGLLRPDSGQVVINGLDVWADPRVADGYTGYPIGGTLACLAVVGVAIIPVIIVILRTNSNPATIRMPLHVLGAAGYGCALAWAGVWIAAATAAHNLPELAQIAVRSKL